MSNGSLDAKDVSHEGCKSKTIDWMSSLLFCRHPAYPLQELVQTDPSPHIPSRNRSLNQWIPWCIGSMPGQLKCTFLSLHARESESLENTFIWRGYQGHRTVDHVRKKDVLLFGGLRSTRSGIGVFLFARKRQGIRM